MDKLYMGNCVNSFDEQGNCLLDIFSDTSDFACSLERAEEIPAFENDFECDEFSYDKLRNVYFAYNSNEDIHYFFVSRYV